MKRPTRVKIGPYRLVVRFDSNGLDDSGAERGAYLYGDSSMRKALIRVRADLPRDVEAETMLHEVLHMVAATCSLGLDYDEEEKVVQRMSPVLFGVLRDNPALVAYLTGRTA